MVLVSNEWQNKCEDDQKTNTNTTTTTATTTTATTSTAAAATSIADSSATEEKNNQNKSEPVAGDIINSTKSKDTLTIESETAIRETILNKSVANDNANNEKISETLKDKKSREIINKIGEDNDDDKNECKIVEVANLFASAKHLKADHNLETSLLNYNNSIKSMAENSKESLLKEEKQEVDLQSQILIDNNHAGNNKYLDESISYQNSNTNTLIPPEQINDINKKMQQYNCQQHITQQQQQQQQQVPLSCPIVPQTLGSALQTALNANNNANNANNSVAAAGLQPNFLSQLASTANVAGLQITTTTAATILTAKQLNQSFNMLDSNNQNKAVDNTSATSTIPVVPAVTYDNNGQAKIVLICESNSHPFQSRTISLTPNVECMVGRLIAKSKASENNAIFDCKVLSRKHAVIWYTPDGKFWVKDTKSSNGTFINDNKLGDEEAELHFGDIVKFGVDVLENSRKEVHGCIIACVKLYLPDGREAISIDSSVHRSQYSGEGRISYDELHRLNLYIQETSQREKVLTSKLCNIQNVLDATRKNSSLCWQSMITEDQLLHRIHSLEKKLQFMEKNVPENILRNEVLKLLEDKNSYQHTAKEALRKVYQERCEAMQMLAKMESAYTQSDNECSLLRDQIMNSKQILQEVNTRLLRLETEYNEYKDEVLRQQQEPKDLEEQHITMLTEKLQERELECEDLKKKVSELLVSRNELHEYEDKLLEKQAIDKLDAAIADMDLANDDDSEDDEDNNEENNEIEITSNKKPEEPKNDVAPKFNYVSKELQKKSTALKSPPKRVKETTIMKWLRNSDINKNEGSFDIFKAICNENDDGDIESEVEILAEYEGSKSAQMPDNLALNETDLYSNFTKNLKNVQKYLKELESMIEIETKSEQSEVKFKLKSEDETTDEDDNNEGACAENEFIIESNERTCASIENHLLSKENKKYLLLKSSVNMLREAYNEIWDNVKEKEEIRCHKQNNQFIEKKPSNVKIKTQPQTYNTSPTHVTTLKNNDKSKLQCSEFDNTESDSETESLTLSTSVTSNNNVTVVNVKTDTINQQLQEQLNVYKSQVAALDEKLKQTEIEADHTLEIMQVECDDFKLKMQNLNTVIETLKNDKKTLEKIVDDYKNNVQTTSITSTPNSKENDAQIMLGKELELEEDPIINAINVSALEREEELITYKERLDEQQRENIDLRNEIVLLRQKAKDETANDLVFKHYLPCCVIAFAIIIYFLITYY